MSSFTSPLGQKVFDRTYSRVKEDGTKESWNETVSRVVKGNLGLVDASPVSKEGHRLRELIGDCALLPAGRHLWATGVHGYLMNCFTAGWIPGDPAEHFTFTAARLFEGGGVGSNYSQDLMGAVVFPRERRLAVSFGDTGWAVPDSREGWVEALRRTLAATDSLVFDLSGIRPAGAPLRTFGGQASGPGPLAALLTSVGGILNGAVGTPLTWRDAMDIDHAIATAVVAGGARRSARMSFMHWDDPNIHDFMACKGVDGAHWSTNISVEVDKDFMAGEPGATKVLDEIVAGMLANGEPGIFNSTRASEGEDGPIRYANPCNEIAMEPFENCNLGHVNLAAFADRPDGELYEAFRLMARFCLRATFATPTDPKTAEINARNRRMGVGFLGYQEWVIRRFGLSYSEAAGNPGVAYILACCQASVREEADAYADELGIPRPIKVTAVAPTGTISLLPGVTSGLQPVFAKMFRRRVQYSNHDPELVALVAAGHPAEPSQTAPDTTVVEFVCRDTIMDRCPAALVEDAEEVDLGTYLMTMAMVQTHYADNAISVTVNLPPEGVSARTLAGELNFYLPELKGVTIMPSFSRAQMPYERLSEREYSAALNAPVTFASVEQECVSGCPVR